MASKERQLVRQAFAQAIEQPMRNTTVRVVIALRSFRLTRVFRMVYDRSAKLGICIIMGVCGIINDNSIKKRLHLALCRCVSLQLSA